jgi:hypothetical protein
MADPTPVPDIEQWSHELAGPLPRADTDAAAGFDILDSFERFNQRNDIFCRSFWDPTVRSAKTEVFYETYRKPLSGTTPFATRPGRRSRRTAKRRA